MRRVLLAAALICLVGFVGCGKSEEPAKAGAAGDDAWVNSIFREQYAEYKAGAEDGDADAQKGLGMMFYLGQGMEPDYAKAYVWLKKAADQGQPVAQMMLGVMHAQGQGIPQDYVKAHMWLSLSTEQGTAQAGPRLEEVTQRMTAEQIAEAEDLVENWRPGS